MARIPNESFSGTELDGIKWSTWPRWETFLAPFKYLLCHIFTMGTRDLSGGGGEGEILNGQLVFLTVINLEYIYENLKTFLVVNIFTTSDKRS